MVGKQLEKSIKILKSDRDREYTSNDMTLFCEEYRIIHENIAFYSPHSNEVTKRKHHTLIC